MLCTAPLSLLMFGFFLVFKGHSMTMKNSMTSSLNFNENQKPRWDMVHVKMLIMFLLFVSN